MSRRPPIKLPPGMIEQIYANIGVCYQCGRQYESCKCDPTPARLPPVPTYHPVHVPPPDTDQEEINVINNWLDDDPRTPEQQEADDQSKEWQSTYQSLLP